MAVREILQIGHPVLRRSAREVTSAELASAEVQGLIDDLIDTMHTANGAGIAANQVGEPVRIAVITGSVFKTMGEIDGLSDTAERPFLLGGGCGKFEQFPL